MEKHITTKEINGIQKILNELMEIKETLNNNQPVSNLDLILLNLLTVYMK
ncbi:MAG: hypothetical protein NC184_07540 [Roseburia sp.]|nr:hypothetical protein [Roseburia sp.]